MELPVEPLSPTKEIFGVHAKYTATFLDRIDRKLAKLQVPVHVVPLPHSAAEGLEYSEEGLLFLSPGHKEVKEIATPPRYNFTTPPKGEPSPKRQKASGDEESSSSSSSERIVEQVPRIAAETLIKLYESFQCKPPDPTIPAPPLQESDYVADVDMEKEGARPTRKTKDVIRYVDEDAEKDDDSETKKRKASKRKGKEPVVLRDIQKYDPANARPFHTLTNPENLRRCKLAKATAGKGIYPLSYGRLNDCEFTDQRTHPSWKVWKTVFRRAMISALGIFYDCTHLLSRRYKDIDGSSPLFTEWLKDVRTECEIVLQKLPICKLPDDLDVPCCSILILVPQYEIVEFSGIEDEFDEHIVRFRKPRYEYDELIAYSREFRVPSSSLAQILQLHSVLFPVYMMEQMAKALYVACALPVPESKSEKLDLFQGYRKQIESDEESPLQTLMTTLATHSFSVWWFYQKNFGIKFAQNMIETREKQKGPVKSNTPTAGNRRGLGF
jgi:hypothetical protein